MSAAGISWVEDLFAAQFLAAVLLLSSAMAASSFTRSRAVLILRFARSRTFQLMRLLGLNPWAYLRQTSTVLVEAQVHSCEGCSKRGHCQDILGRAAPVEDLGFCPNASAIARFRLGGAGA